jgi:hypothetical protein
VCWVAKMSDIPGVLVSDERPSGGNALSGSPRRSRMAMVSARSSGVMCGSAYWIGARGVGQVRTGPGREPREVAGAGGSSAQFAVMGAILSDRAAVSPKTTPADPRLAERRAVVRVLSVCGSSTWRIADSPVALDASV